MKDSTLGPCGARDALSCTSSLFSHESPLFLVRAGYQIIQSFTPRQENLVNLASCLCAAPSGTAANEAKRRRWSFVPEII